MSAWDLTALVMMFGTGLVRGGLPSYAGPGWSVLIEFQFYLLIPFILIFMRRYGAKYLVGVLLVCLLLRFIVFEQRHIVQDISYYTLFGRMDQFVLGMIAARLTMTGRATLVLNRPVVSSAVFVIALTAFSYFYKWFNLQGGLLELNGEAFPSKSALWIVMPSIEAIFYSVILLTYLHLPAVPRMAWVSRAFAYLGVISYSIYLDHAMLFPVISGLLAYAGFSADGWRPATLAFLLVALPIYVLVASLTYYVVELPFMHLKRPPRVKDESVV